MSRDLEIAAIEAHPLCVGLRRPFVIASAALESIQNAVVRLRLRCGAVGFGEIASLPPVTDGDRQTTARAVDSAGELLAGRDGGAWRRRCDELREQLPDLPAVRAGIEVALLDALCRVWGVPLLALFGGGSQPLVTAITIPICDAAEARQLASGYRDRGFDTLKVKVGRELERDVERLVAIRAAHPSCRLIADANGGFSAEQAMQLVGELRGRGVALGLLEQPVARGDLDGLALLRRDSGVAIAADESCRDGADALQIAARQAASVLNIKLAKGGVIAALEIAAIARAAGLSLMIGGMVETRIGMGAAAHLAAGLGGFDWIDLDTPLLLAGDPVAGGVAIDGPRYRIDASIAGHGGRA